MSLRTADQPKANSPSWRDDWLTPPAIISALGEFDLDPCAPSDRPWDMARNHFTVLTSGLLQPWEGRVWLNPPYGKEAWDWVSKLALHGDGIALIFARTETEGFHRFVWGAAQGLFFFKGRIYFHRVDGSKTHNAGAPSVLVAYGDRNAEALRTCGLAGKYIGLW